MKAKETRADQSTLQVFLLWLNQNDSQTFQRSSWEKCFPQCVFYRGNLFQWMIFIQCDQWKTFFLKACRYIEIFSTAILLFSLKQVFWKKSLQKQSPEGVLQKGVLKNFAKFTGKHLCQSLLYITGVFLWILRNF